MYSSYSRLLMIFGAGEFNIGLPKSDQKIILILLGILLLVFLGSVLVFLLSLFRVIRAFVKKQRLPIGSIIITVIGLVIILRIMFR
jgi:hypothetical protein